jgi:hypothetical protein
MRLLKQAMAVLGSVVVIAVIAALVTPRTAHAIIATAVQVVNTASQPVPNRDVDNPAKEPFQANMCIDAGTQFGNCRLGGLPGFVQVPTTTTDNAVVKRLVIEYVDAVCFVNGSGLITAWGLSITVNENVQNVQSGLPSGELVHDFLPQLAPGSPGPLLISQQTRLYADPGTVVGSSIADTAGVTGYQCQGTITGHLVTQ